MPQIWRLFALIDACTGENFYWLQLAASFLLSVILNSLIPGILETQLV
jgi:hypothetical protein